MKNQIRSRQEFPMSQKMDLNNLAAAQVASSMQQLTVMSNHSLGLMNNAFTHKMVAPDPIEAASSMRILNPGLPGSNPNHVQYGPDAG